MRDRACLCDRGFQRRFYCVTHQWQIFILMQSDQNDAAEQVVKPLCIRDISAQVAFDLTQQSPEGFDPFTENQVKTQLLALMNFTLVPVCLPSAER